MYSGALVLACSAALAFFANLLSSTYLSTEDFGRVVSYASLTSILSFALCWGFGGYYLANRDTYVKHESSIAATPIIVGFLAGCVWVALDPSMLALAYSGLLLLTIASNQGVLKSQVHGNTISTALYQASPSLAKTIAAVALLGATFFSRDARVEIDRFFVFNCALAAGSSLLIVTLLYRIFNNLRSTSDFGFHFISEIKRKGIGLLFSFWASSLLSLSYSMALPPLVALKHGFEYSAYLGIYYIFWSVNSLIVTALVNNHFLPVYARVRGDKSLRMSLERKITLVSLLIGVLSVVMVLLGEQVGSKYVWQKYGDLPSFLLIVSSSLFFRSLSAGLGVLLSFQPYIKAKAIIQFLVFLAAVALVSLLPLSSKGSLAIVILLLEVFLFAGYLFSVVALKRTREEKCN